jgi:general secretion pathway protein A
MYNQHFGFLESPFSLTPDPGFFYATPAYLEAYATLRYGIQAKKGFIAVTGEVGTGKTTLLRKLMRELQSPIHFALILNTHLSYDELLRVILRDLGLATETNDRIGMVDALNTYLLEQLHKGHTVCALIDEAQNLSDESLEGLRLLSNLETDKEKLLQIVLMGQPEFRVKLNKPSLRQLKQRIAIQCELPPLKTEQVGPYIEFRLGAAGYEGGTLFPRAAVREIAHSSRGIPRLINIICDNSLLITFAASQSVVSSSSVAEVVADLGLRTQAHVEGPKTISLEAQANGGNETFIREAATPDAGAKKPRLKSGAGAFCVILISLTVFFISEPQLVFTSALKTFEAVKQNSQQWLGLVSRPALLPALRPVSPPEAPPPPAEENPREQRVTIRYGSTIYGIASDIYGANAVLGMDLLKELNPQIQNLNWISAGQEILLPALTEQTLLRRQPDGSYRIIVGSFFSQREADQLAARIINAGYQILITPKRLSNNLSLYRLEIDSLKNMTEATHGLEAGLKNEWITLAVKTDNRQTGTPESGY